MIDQVVMRKLPELAIPDLVTVSRVYPLQRRNRPDCFGDRPPVAFRNAPLMAGCDLAHENIKDAASTTEVNLTSRCLKGRQQSLSIGAECSLHRGVNIRVKVKKALTQFWWSEAYPTPMTRA